MTLFLYRNMRSSKGVGTETMSASESLQTDSLQKSHAAPVSVFYTSDQA